MQKISYILLDFDGVITKNSINISFSFIYNFISKFYPLPYEVIKNYCKITVNFPIYKSIELFFSSFGLHDKIDEFLRSYHETIEDNYTKIKIENDFHSFLLFCMKENIQIKIATMNDKKFDKRLKLLNNYIDDKHIISLTDYSKADNFCYKNLISTFDCKAENVLSIDDSPIALMSASMNEIKTIMMLNDIFTYKDYLLFKKYINYTARSFKQIEGIIKRIQNKR